MYFDSDILEIRIFFSVLIYPSRDPKTKVVSFTNSYDGVSLTDG